MIVDAKVNVPSVPPKSLLSLGNPVFADFVGVLPPITSGAVDNIFSGSSAYASCRIPNDGPPNNRKPRFAGTSLAGTRLRNSIEVGYRGHDRAPECRTGGIPVTFPFLSLFNESSFAST